MKRIKSIETLIEEAPAFGASEAVEFDVILRRHVCIASALQQLLRMGELKMNEIIQTPMWEQGSTERVAWLQGYIQAMRDGPGSLIASIEAAKAIDEKGTPDEDEVDD